MSPHALLSGALDDQTATRQAGDCLSDVSWLGWLLAIQVGPAGLRLPLNLIRPPSGGFPQDSGVDAMETELCELTFPGRWAGLTPGPPSERVAFWASVPQAVPRLSPTQKGLVQKQDRVRTLLLDPPRNATLHPKVRSTGWAWQFQRPGTNGTRLDSVGGSCGVYPAIITVL